MQKNHVDAVNHTVSRGFHCAVLHLGGRGNREGEGGGVWGGWVGGVKLTCVEAPKSDFVDKSE